MIQPNELRVGNYILVNGNITQIDILSMNEIMQDIASNIILGICGKNINPIPITEDILLWCGFRKQDSEYEKGHPNYCEWLERTFPIIGCVYQCDTKDHLLAELNGTELHIHYLHQLQNLYYALTGKELEIKL